MGFDVTFHPISWDELHTFVFDVVDNPALAEQRAAALTVDPQKQRRIREIYGHFEEWKEEVRAGDASFSSTYAFATAAIAGFLHPYWYARGAAITFLCEEKNLYCATLESLVDLAPSTFAGMSTPQGGLFEGNYSGGGFADSTKLAQLEMALCAPEHAEAVDEVMGEEGLRALQQAIRYARTHGLGLLEASDVAVPFSGASHTDGDNLRADFLKNEGDVTNARRSGTP